ncbi:hypothetical protein MMC21_004987 [Puttea exsequens]|nr:hypothetical protein [Puttea exsequens]
MSHGEALHEIGRLTQLLDHKESQIQQLKESKEALDQTNDDMAQQLAHVQAQLQRTDWEKTNLMNELDNLNRGMSARDAAMKKMNEDMVRAQKTIKVQSDQICGKNPSNKVAATPHHYSIPSPVPDSALFNSPPSFSGNHTAPSTPVDNGHGGSLSRQLGAPPPMQLSFDSDFFAHSDRDARNGSLTAMTDSFSSQVALLSDQDVATTSLAAEHSRFFQMTESWARNYVNVPDKSRDQSLPTPLLANLKQLTNPDIFVRLLSTGSTRYFAIAKLMNSTIVNVALRPIMLKGFATVYDKKLADLRVSLQKVGIPLTVRRGMLTANADLVTEITQSPGFQSFLDDFVARQQYGMWNQLESLFAPGVAREEAWEDLGRIWREASRIGLIMMSRPSTFNVDFPPVGSSSRFNPSNMVNRDVNFRQDPQSLSSMAVTVRLSITPIITETDFNTTPVVPRTLHYANVLLIY